MPEPAALPIVHQADASRFEARLPDGLALCVYRRDGDVLLLTHTEVPVALEGRGIAAACVDDALRAALAHKQALVTGQADGTTGRGHELRCLGVHRNQYGE